MIDLVEVVSTRLPSVPASLLRSEVLGRALQS